MEYFLVGLIFGIVFGVAYGFKRGKMAGVRSVPPPPPMMFFPCPYGGEAVRAGMIVCKSCHRHLNAALSAAAGSRT